MILIRAAAPALQYGDLRNRDVELPLDRLLDALRNGTRRPKATSTRVAPHNAVPFARASYSKWRWHP
jgi:hypothetical protein